METEAGGRSETLASCAQAHGLINKLLRKKEKSGPLPEQLLPWPRLESAVDGSLPEATYTLTLGPPGNGEDS